MTSPIESRIRAGFGFALALVITLAIVSYLGTRKALAVTKSLEHSEAIVATLEGLLIAELDRDAAIRDFVLTGDASALERSRSDRLFVPSGKRRSG